jgi:hypothetical protein
MTNYAIKDGSAIINVIVAETKEIAEEVTNLEAIEITEELPLGIGWELVDGEWKMPESLIIPLDDSTETVIPLEESTEILD